MGARRSATSGSGSATQARSSAVSRVGKQLQAASRSVGNTVAKTTERAGKPALGGAAAAASIATAVAARRSLKPKPRKVLGMPLTRNKFGILTPNGGFDISSLSKNLPSPSKLDIDSVAKGVARTGQQVGRTGQQLSKLGTDIQRAGETTARVGKLLSK